MVGKMIYPFRMVRVDRSENSYSDRGNPRPPGPVRVVQVGKVIFHFLGPPGGGSGGGINYNKGFVFYPVSPDHLDHTNDFNTLSGPYHIPNIGNPDRITVGG